MVEILAALAKLLLYAGSLSSAGTAFAATSLASAQNAEQSPASLIIRIGAVAAAIGAIAHVAILILRLGDFSEPTVSAVMDSPTGTALFCQLVGCTLLLVFGSPRDFYRVIGITGGLILIASYGVNGHAASTSFLSGAVAVTHVGMAAWWLGALLLLRPASRTYSSSDLQKLVQRFSNQAMITVGCLVLAGSILILTLIDFSRPDWFSPYAQVLVAKLALAASLIGLAAYNKLRLTPELGSEDGVAIAALRRTIAIEILLISGVLAATAALTTYTSPHT